MRYRSGAVRGTALAAVVLLSVGVGGCSGASLGGKDGASVGQELRIGLILPRSGPYKAIGDDMLRGWQLYLATHGDKLGGRPVKVIEVDEGNGGEPARAAAAKLLQQDRVVAVVGGGTADTVQTLNPMLLQAKVPMVGIGGRPSTINDVSFVWHTSWMSQETGAAVADHVRTTVDGPVYVVGPDYLGGREQIGGFVDRFRAGGGKLANEGGEPTWTRWAPTPETNFEPVLTSIRRSGAKAIYAFYAGRPAVEFVKQRKQFGVNLPLYGAGFLTEGAVLAAQGPAAEGVFTCMNYVADLSNAANQEFVRAHKERFGGAAPTVYAVTAWDAALVLDRATAMAAGAPAVAGGNEAGGLTSASLNAAISQVGEIRSPRGDWRFGPRHTPVQRWYLRQVRGDGRNLANVLVKELGTLGT
jgi:branched-chain amino acid transport system substrate-binding protein